MTLQNLLTEIINNNNSGVRRNQLLGASTGVQFERLILEKLTSNSSYIVKSKNDYRNHERYREIKDMIQSSNHKDNFIEVPGICSYFNDENNRLIIEQPHGKNDYPDFLLIYQDKILPLEIKFSKDNGETPVWNGGYPRSKSIYIFGSYGREDITFFNGDSYISSAERMAMISIMDFAEREMNRYSSEQTDYNPNNFSVYLRRMYNQKFSSLRTENRTEHELRAIQIVSSDNF